MKSIIAFNYQSRYLKYDIGQVANRKNMDIRDF
jgi:hypothetical protein